MTTIEQSKELLAHGFTNSEADMCWCGNTLFNRSYTELSLQTNTVSQLVPCFSDAVLLNLLPNEIKLNNKTCDLHIGKKEINDNIYWVISYKRGTKVQMIASNTNLTKVLVQIHCKIYDSFPDETKEVINILQ